MSQRRTSTSYRIAPFEVALHNEPNDAWVSLLGKVLDVTSLLREFEGQDCVGTLIGFLGKDVSHWFDEETGDVLHHVHPVTGARVPRFRIPHVEPQVPTTQWKPLSCKPWWKDDDKYLVGYLTKRVRPIRILNTCISKEVVMNVCCEDDIYRIWERFSVYNSNPGSYVWRCNDKTLDLGKTLEENGVPDERDSFTRIGLPASLCTPVIYIYYADDFIY